MPALSAFLRKMPVEALREYFDRPEIGLPIEFDWSVPEAELPGPLMRAIEEMSRVQRDRILNDAERVHALSDGPGEAALHSVAEDPAFLDGLANPHARVNAGGILQRQAGVKVQHGRKQEGPRYRGPSCLSRFIPEGQPPTAVLPVLGVTGAWSERA